MQKFDVLYLQCSDHHGHFLTPFEMRSDATLAQPPGLLAVLPRKNEDDGILRLQGEATLGEGLMASATGGSPVAVSSVAWAGGRLAVGSSAEGSSAAA